MYARRQTTVAQIAARYKDLNLKQWDAATTGTPEALEAMAAARGMAALLRGPRPYQQYKAWDESGAAGDDPLLARQVHLLHLMFAEGQRDPETIDEMTALQKALDDAYTNFRAEVGGKRLTANAIDQILAEENDSEKRREAWEASKQIGPVVADGIAAARRHRQQHMG